MWKKVIWEKEITASWEIEMKRVLIQGGDRENGRGSPAPSRKGRNVKKKKKKKRNEKKIRNRCAFVRYKNKLGLILVKNSVKTYEVGVTGPIAGAKNLDLF